MNRKRPEPIAVPEEKKTSYVLTNNGTFVEGDLTISREGLQINSPASTLGAARPGSANSLQPNKRPLPQEEDSASSRGPGEASTSGNGAALTSPHTRCGASASSEPLTLDDFEEICVIGQGSSGVAKKVRNKRDGRLMVLKVIQFDVSSDVIRKQVTTELRTLYGAAHRNVVKYSAAWFDNGAITIAMEYCDAGSLADLLKRLAGPGLPEPVIAHIARQLVAGLHYLHKELKVVHRDIKPSNLLLNGKGEVKISDFGVSGQLASSVSNCLSWVGTVTYMSPERIKGDSYSFDSDLWSLGLTLLECALGRFPYPPPGESTGVNLGFWELLEYIVIEPAPTLPADQFSPELVDFVAQCLQKDAKARASVTTLAQHPFLKLHPDASLQDVLEPVMVAAGTVAAAAAVAPLPPPPPPQAK
ncbi:hypothetical protein VOLCADRAFT_73333 [Volvox carteri f. nagariensis]|uniref:mitogen-activated protein kinase kinase n=1 Tax=Volvox carteri f. nagariensis TaxID=3068 RepID=D8TMB5_VOLCA|nr:uncharacterized protein VOLCADRAFT_73333 [Volvox carteri f. nagariensis]EFJ51614.1 hypothetical protein VOLCADRAFT_73333 [Volvox carteri f. nagariensis]|eukprot:XP_002947566.1 hypothetical protein VOLCADRAFT_73333 [Volvox carteri f. nagariensis]